MGADLLLHFPYLPLIVICVRPVHTLVVLLGYGDHKISIFLVSCLFVYLLALARLLGSNNQLTD